MGSPPPIALSLLICDSAIEDRGTGKIHILGLFDRIVVPEFPATHPEVAIYAELVEGKGMTAMMCRILRTTGESLDGEEIARLPFQADFSNPFQVVRVILRFQEVVFPVTGEYRASLETAGMPIVERRFTLLARSELP
jgi:hypothetical protein